MLHLHRFQIRDDEVNLETAGGLLVKLLLSSLDSRISEAVNRGDATLADYFQLGQALAFRVLTQTAQEKKSSFADIH